jgi:hypothetical protein
MSIYSSTQKTPSPFTLGNKMQRLTAGAAFR